MRASALQQVVETAKALRLDLVCRATTDLNLYTEDDFDCIDPEEDGQSCWYHFTQSAQVLKTPAGAHESYEFYSAPFGTALRLVGFREWEAEGGGAGESITVAEGRRRAKAAGLPFPLNADL